MAEVKQRTAAKKFVEDWTGKGYEKGESQKFWIQLLGEVLDVEHPAQFISFEDQVHLDHTSFIDGYIPAAVCLIRSNKQKDILQNFRFRSILVGLLHVTFKNSAFTIWKDLTANRRKFCSKIWKKNTIDFHFSLIQAMNT